MIDKKIIMHMAKLARLKMNPEQAAHYGEQLSNVLTHFDQISKIDTANVEPMVNPLEPEFFNDDAARADIPEQLFSAEEMLRNAPDKTGNLFKVPPVVG